LLVEVQHVVEPVQHVGLLALPWPG